jgi:hypothetical protein
MVEAAVVSADDFVSFFEHFGVDEALYALFEEVFRVDGFHAGFRDFEHD